MSTFFLVVEFCYPFSEDRRRPKEMLWLVNWCFLITYLLDYYRPGWPLEIYGTPKSCRPGLCLALEGVWFPGVIYLLFEADDLWPGCSDWGRLFCCLWLMTRRDLLTCDSWVLLQCLAGWLEVSLASGTAEVTMTDLPDSPGLQATSSGRHEHCMSHRTASKAAISRDVTREVPSAFSQGSTFVRSFRTCQNSKPCFLYSLMVMIIFIMIKSSSKATRFWIFLVDYRQN